MSLSLFYLYIRGIIVCSAIFNPILTTLVLSMALIAALSCDQPINYPPGGYDYPAKDSVTDTNFYFYPLRNIFPRRDSFEMSASYLYYQTFDEPNLSVAAKGEDFFRFTFSGFKFLPVMIVFTKNQMTIKTGSIDYMTDGMIDENRLDELEKKHFRYISRRYPYYSSNENDIRYHTKYVDSMLKVYPKLLSLSYYKYLLNKATVPNGRHLHSYTTKKINLPYGEFRHLVSIINDSGFWKLPYSLPQISESSDGYGFSLEANTKSKYNIVRANCDSDPKNSFFSICKEIVKCAGLEKQVDVFFLQPEALHRKPILIQDVTLADVKEDSSNLPKHKKSKHKK